MRSVVCLRVLRQQGSEKSIVAKVGVLLLLLHAVVVRWLWVCCEQKMGLALSFTHARTVSTYLDERSRLLGIGHGNAEN
jgi:hypothetical protein